MFFFFKYDAICKNYWFFFLNKNGDVLNTYIILLRAVNVGGKNLIPMKTLKSALTDGGFEKVHTYIQSGNILLQSKSNPSNKIVSIIENQFGFRPSVLAISKESFEKTLKENPFPSENRKIVHLYFCHKTPLLNKKKLESFIAKDESFKLLGKIFYLHAPSGIGRSKLVANIEACLGVTATGRNLNTILKLNEMLNSL